MASRPGDRVAWRTLDGAGLFAARPAAGAVAERTLAECLRRDLGVAPVARADGNGFELAGISEGIREEFSSRRQVIEPRLAELAAEYRRRHGREPHARALWSMAQFVTLDSRAPKAHSAPSREELLARWETRSGAGETQLLSEVADAALRGGAAGRAGVLAGAEVGRVLAAAVAEVLNGRSVFTRYELIRMINRHLPDDLGGLSGERVTGLLEELADLALRPGGPCGVVLVTAPEMVPVPAAYRRGDGLSWWRRHGAEVYTTRGQLDAESRLLRAAAQAGAARVAPERAAAALGADRARIEAALWRGHASRGADAAPPDTGGPLSSAGLSDDQAQAAYGVLTSGRAIDILVGAAGTGKTRVVAVLAGIWAEAGTGRVIGLTTSTSAAHVLAGEGVAETHNLARFLGRLPGTEETRGHLPVCAGDLLVIDEASMVPTRDLAAVEEIATRCGAKILLTGDPAQLSAPGAGGAMRLLAGEHGCYQLAAVQRFEHEWERAASLRLRAGDHEVLAEYDRRGRFLDGSREEMNAAACRRWLADHLSGLDALLVATTNVQAAELARRVRGDLAGLGLVERADVAELADGNVAGPGDLIVARRNARIPAGEPGRMLANRDVLRIERWAETGELRSAVVRRCLGRDPGTGEMLWGGELELPEAYVEQDVQLAYAGNVHVAQGRTVDAAHLVADETAGREAFYVGMSRGRQSNTAYLVQERTRIADVSPAARVAPDLRDPAAGLEAPWLVHRFAVLAAILDREQGDLAATEVMRRELEEAASLAVLAPVWTDLTRTHATRGYEEVIRGLLPDQEWQRFEQDAERGTLARLLRAADLAGHDAGEVLGRAVTRRGFEGADSVAAVLHGRVRRITGTAEPLARGGYEARTPRIGDPEAAGMAVVLARAMDARAEVLGERAALDRPAWALRYLSDVPADPLERGDWVRRASFAAAYREERGYGSATDAIGPAPGRGSPELRASWHAAFTALRMPEPDRELAAATDGELLARRAAYERETRWAPPYVARELRDAVIAADTYRADALLAWYRADAAGTQAGRDQAEREAGGLGLLAQETGAHRDVLAEIDQARRAWHAATETSRQRALTADSELRRRRPGTDLPPVQGEERLTAEAGHPGSGLTPDPERVAAAGELSGALGLARRAHAIIAAREHGTGRETELDGGDLMRRREADALADVAARQSAVRQEPLPSRRARSGRRQETEMEAGQ